MGCGRERSNNVSSAFNSEKNLVGVHILRIVRVEMPFLRVIAPIILAVGLVLAPSAMGTAFAEGEAPPVDDAVMAHQLACEDGVCSLRVDIGPNAPSWLPTAGFALSVLEDNLSVLPDGTGISVRDGLALDMPIGNLKLADAKIDLTIGEDGSVESFYGTAELAAPSLNLFGRTTSKKPIATVIGYDRASAMPEMAATLDPERKYLFFDLAAGTELSAELNDGSDGALWLSIPDGQRATVVIDPIERFAFIDGNVTLRYSGNMAFLSQLLDPAETVELFTGELPIRHQVTVHLTGVVTDQLADSHLEFAGRYAVDGGKVAEWLNVNGEPLALEGGIVISGEGLLGTGIVRSTVMPENVWNSAVQAQIFVPFSTDFQDAYLALNSRVDIPFANLSADGTARVNGSLETIADGNLHVPWISGDADLFAEAGEAAETVGVAVNASGGNRWSNAWSATSDGVRTGLELTRKPAGAAVDWIRDTAGSGLETASDGLEWSIDTASSQWCSTTGYCHSPDGESGTATAMR